MSKKNVYPSIERFNVLKNNLPLIALILVIFLWGISFISIKVVVKEVSPFTFAFLRFLISSLILFFVFLRIEGREKFKSLKNIGKKDILLIIVGGIFGFTIFYSLQIPGVKLTTASSSSMIYAITPVFAFLADFLLYSSKISVKKLFGIVISLLGTYMIIYTPDSTSIPEKFYIGNLLIVLSVVVWVVYLLINKQINDKISDITIVTFQTIAGAVFIAPLALYEYKFWQGISLIAFLNILFLALFCSAIAYFLFIYCSRKLSVTTVSIYQNLIPVVGVLASFIVLHERVSLLQIIGGAIIIGGVTLVTLREENKTSENLKEKSVDL